MNSAFFASLAAQLAALLGADLPGSTRAQYLLIVGAGLLILGAALVSLLRYLKSRRRKHPHHRSHHRSGKASSPARQGDSRTARTPGRRRRRREYPRRPTLAESGGLPPLRQPPSGPKDFLSHG